MLQLSSFHLHNSAVNRNTCYYKYIQQTRKNVLWHILAPSAVACDNLHLRASAHHRRVSAFLCNREFLGISYYIKKLPQLMRQPRNYVSSSRLMLNARSTFLRISSSR